jgi:carbon monoxide dehydrogenase subunit G
MQKGGRTVRLDHEFTVPATVADVWVAVTDPERVAPCMPGASLTKVEGDEFSGTVKVKLGPISLLYKGSGEFLEKDEAAGKVVIKASGKDARGSGTAAATVTLTLIGDGETTHGKVATDLAITGKPAQFGRGMISEVGGKILDSFAACLSEKLGAAPEPEPEPVSPAQAQPESAAEAGSPRPKLESVKPVPEPEAIDLFDYAGASVIKRLAPIIAGAAGLLIVVAIIRALRRR